MYEPHSIGLFILGFLLAGVALAAASVLRGTGRVKIPQWVLFAIGLVAILQLLLAQAIRFYDQWRMREEFRQLSPGRIEKMVIGQDGRTNQVADPARIGELLALVRPLAGVAAHHSHPVNQFDVVFELPNYSYRWRIGRDSERPEEYWVELLGRGRAGQELEIGRVHSARLGQFLEDLLNPKR